MKNAMAGCNMESELVMAARNNRKNQRKPKKLPTGIAWNTCGRVSKPRAKVESLIPAGPRKIKAAGMVISPPSATSAKIFPEAEVVPDNTTSSLRRTELEYVIITPNPTEREKNT